MGFGGDLISTAAIRAYHKATGKQLTLAYTPGLTDILSGHFYRRDRSPIDNPIFKGNPRCKILHPRRAGKIPSIIDRIFFALLQRLRLRKKYEYFVFHHCKRMHPDLFPLFHIDMEIHSYAQSQNLTRIIWKPTSTASEGVLSLLLPEHRIKDNQCEIYWTAEEHFNVKRLLQKEGISPNFIALEPGTNAEYFSNLRAWPQNRWQKLTTRLLQTYPHIPIVQLGLNSTPLLDGAHDLRSKVSFREASLITKHSSLFICTEGGLMHGACAAGAQTVVLWGGLTLPSFACYPDKMRIIHHLMPCAPCGKLGNCTQNVKCMKSITIDEVFSACRDKIGNE